MEGWRAAACGARFGRCSRLHGSSEGVRARPVGLRLSNVRRRPDPLLATSTVPPIHGMSRMPRLAEVKNRGLAECKTLANP